MAGNRRKSTSAKKKKAGRRNVQETNNNVPTNTNPPDINDVLSQADAALESFENALQLYSYAAGVLRNFFQALSSNMASSNEEKESSALLLSSVLGKMAEAKVSMGDQESAQQDFLEATKLLSGDGPANNLVASAQWKEARASLYLYLGQLSNSADALEAFTRAITDLRACAALLEEFLKENSSDESVKEASLDTR